MERNIAALARKAARKLVSTNGNVGPIKLEPEALKTQLGHALFVAETAEKIAEFGIATGLAWTPVGGEVLFIEVTRMPGKGGFLLTGSLGDVMKESAQTAFSYLRSQAGKLGLELRAGLHTGECELRGDDVAGIAVHLGARVGALATAGEVLVTSTVRDLTLGSGIEFEDRGRHELKGIPGDWQVLAVAS